MLKFGREVGCEGSKSMTMGPWIHRHPILSVDQTALNGRFSLALEQLPRIGDMAWPLVGRAALPSWPKAPCHVHLLHMSIFVTILAKLWFISYIQIILQAQVELGEL